VQPLNALEIRGAKIDGLDIWSNEDEIQIIPTTTVK